MPQVVWRRIWASGAVLAVLFATKGAGLGLVADVLVTAVCLVIILASTPATWVRPRSRQGGPMLPKDVEEELVVSDRTFDQHTLFGTHNSTHQCSLFGWLFVRSWRYTHSTILDQLDDGVRNVELDVWYNITTQAWEVRHENLVDCLTTQDTPESLRELLRNLKGWSDAHPSHFPLVLNVDIKGSYVEGLGWAAPLIGRGLTSACPHAEPAYRTMKADIEEIFGHDRICTPAHVKKLNGHAESVSVRESIVSGGWPKVSAMKGRAVFLLNLYGAIAGSASACDPAFFFVRGHEPTCPDSVYYEVGIAADETASKFMWRSLQLSTLTLQPSMYALDDLSPVAQSVTPSHADAPRRTELGFPTRPDLV